MSRIHIKQKMLALGGAMLLTVAVNGSASAATQVLNCYGPDGQAVACTADYANDDAASASRAGQMFHPSDDQPALPTGEKITVIAVAPGLETSPADTVAPNRSGRPGLGGEWSPAIEAEPLDRLQRWEESFLGGAGLSAGW